MAQPAQRQDRQPGLESEMTPRPDFMPRLPGRGRFAGRTALISGGDSGIGRAVAVAFAREGASVVVLYLDEHEDAQETIRLIEAEGAEGLALAGDIGDEAFCREAVARAVERFGGIDVLVNNAAEQHPTEDFGDIPTSRIERTFRTNVFGPFFVTREALGVMRPGASIVNTTSVTAYKGSAELIDYAATRGAIVAFTRSLSQALVGRGIRVNAVAPGPIWTPLIPASFDEDRVARHGRDVPMERAGQPFEVATCHLFLASEEASYMTGQVLHPNGGTVVGS
jgi:NAD(P)-dependent dehydrogenase (short-subunit alcohol dehydrogenase family)